MCRIPRGNLTLKHSTHCGGYPVPDGRHPPDESGCAGRRCRALVRPNPVRGARQPDSSGTCLPWYFNARLANSRMVEERSDTYLRCALRSAGARGLAWWGSFPLYCAAWIEAFLGVGEAGCGCPRRLQQRGCCAGVAG